MSKIHIGPKRRGATPRTFRHIAVGLLVSALLTSSYPAVALALAADDEMTQAEDAGDPTQRAVPAPDRNTAVITVKVGGDRAANGAVQPLAGVRLALHGAGTPSTSGNWADPNMPTQGQSGARYNPAWSWTSCTSDADGDCSFVIPIRNGSTPTETGVARNTRFWVVQEASPEGWYANPQLRVGGYNATPEMLWDYRFRTDSELRPGVVYSSTAAMPLNSRTSDPDTYFMRNRPSLNSEGTYSANVSRTTGVWHQSRNNPNDIGVCPTNVALISDTSGSLGAQGMSDMKNTMSAFVDAFRGTSVRMSAFSFSLVSPGYYASNHPEPLSIGDPEQAAKFKEQYAGWAQSGPTNWDSGFSTVANSGTNYDLALILTDGNPTVNGSHPDPRASAFNALQDVDAGVFSANQLKAQGTRILGLGVGPGFTSAGERNLRAVSGPVQGHDYFRASTFAEATEFLTELVKRSCGGSVSVQKLIVPEHGSADDAVPAPAGWEFSASASAGATVAGAPAQVTGDASAGKVQFGLRYGKASRTGAVEIHERQQDGFAVFPIDGKNAVCTNPQSGAPVSVENAGDDELPGFSLNTTESEHIECKIYNRVVSPANITVHKSADPSAGTAVSPGQRVSYTLTFENTGGRAADIAYDDVLSGVLDDADLVGSPVAEEPLVAAYDHDSERMRVTGTLHAGEKKTVSYAVVVKDLLPASANGLLSNMVVPAGEDPPPTCAPEDPRCTEHPVVGSLSWQKIGAGGGTALLGGSEWTLTPYLADNTTLDTDKTIAVTDCTEATCVAGGDLDPKTGQFKLENLVPGKYQLAETRAPAGYQLLRSGIDVEVDSNVTLGGIENTQMVVPGLPFTGGLGEQSFWAAALALGIAAAVPAVARQRKPRGTMLIDK